MSTVDLSTYKNLYITTSFEQLQKMEEGIQVLRANTGSKEGIDAVYINAHTLVSKSMLMGYAQIGELAHQIEKLFLSIKEEKTSLSVDVLNILSSASEGLRKGLETIKDQGHEIDLSSEKTALESITNQNL